MVVVFLHLLLIFHLVIPLAKFVTNKVIRPLHATTDLITVFNLLHHPLSQPILPLFLITLNHLPQPSPSSFNNHWYPDSSTTHHFTHDFSNISLNPSKYKGEEQVRIGDGNSLQIHHVGGSTIPSTTGNFLLSKIYHVPSISKNLVSVKKKICEVNIVFFEFHSSYFYVKDSRTKKVFLHVFPRAYARECVSPFQQHIQLSHPSMQLVYKIISQISLLIKSSSSSGLSSSCCKAKLHQLPYGWSSSQSTTPIQLLFSDVQGPAPVLSRGGFRYYLCFVDDYNRFTFGFFH